MPYSTIKQALKTQPGLKKYSEKAKQAWIHTFNNTLKRHKDEQRAFATAYSVANKIDSFKEWLTEKQQ